MPSILSANAFAWSIVSSLLRAIPDGLPLRPASSMSRELPLNVRLICPFWQRDFEGAWGP